MVRYEFIVQEPDLSKRLDLFWVEQGVPYSRSQIKKWIEERRITVNGQAAKGGYRLKRGDFLELVPQEPIPLMLAPENISLSILYEDQDLLVLDKPAGLVVHPAPGHYSGTLVHALLFHCTDLSGIGGIMRPGIVHRLDKDTSGLMVVAKNDASHQELIRAFQMGRVIKEYQTLVWGGPLKSQGRIENPIGRHPVQRKKMAINEAHGKPAVTEWQIIERFPQGITWLQVGLKTGRTHQIRVHLSSEGWPVVGDPLYGRLKNKSNKKDGPLAEALKGVSRQLLHSCRLSFQHPIQGKPLDFSSPLPRDMEGLIRQLRTGPDKDNPFMTKKT
ncbi:MAG: RluA family pseudouridine synthase [Deltaproteobacteria bacterium]|nr:RluA family pseudouridine synthase [Deltaproteobacteria bacterium]